MTKSSPTPAGPDARVPSQRLTPRALLDVKRLVDPQIHPDGQRVAFSVQEADFEESRWISHIWLTEWLPAVSEVNSEAVGEPSQEASADDPNSSADDGLPTAGDLTRQLTFSAEGETDPLWSPDGRYLAFLSIRPDTSVVPPDEEDDVGPVSQIWALPMDGGEARRITNTTEPILDFTWAPDGQSLLYLTLEPRPKPLESVHRESARRKVDPIVEHDDARRRQFFSVGVEERKPHLLFTADYGVESFALAPQGDRIAYLTNYTGEDNDYHVADLYLHSLETGSTVKLIRRDGGKYRLRWSPTGSHIAFLAWHDPQLSYSRESVYIVEVPSHEALAGISSPPEYPACAAEGAPGASYQHDIRRAKAWIEAPGAVECIPITDLDQDIMSYEWLNDRGGIFALAAVGAATLLYHLGEDLVSPSASQAQSPESKITLTPERAERNDLAVHRESGRVVWVRESGNSPPEIVLRDSDGQERILTEVNVQFAENYRLPRQDVVRWSGADGRLVEGVLTYPLDFQPGERYPLVVQVHGGPKGRATDSLLDYPMPAVWASEGYLVLRPNYRGSEGYGHDFAVANRRDLGGQDYEDVMRGVDWCVAQGLADGERLGILGGSYGGYMVNWAIGHTDRFKAAISMFGIFHLQTDYSNSRLSRWEHDYMGAYYWEDPEIYHKLSPASYLENIHTPTLIIHGDDDDNTAIGNSREIYRALLQRGVPTRFVHYPREGHGIQEPNHRLDELRRCLAWMDRYVRNNGQGLSIYRVGDRVPDSRNHLELCVTSAEIATLIGRDEGPGSRHGRRPSASVPMAPSPHPADTPNRDPIQGGVYPGCEDAQLRSGDVRMPSVSLEVILTIHNLDTRLKAEPLTLALSDICLEDTVYGASGALLTPVGVPLDMPGGKVLVQGENLRVTQDPDPDTGELAFALGVIFQVPASGERLLRVADFPPVVVHWSSADEEPPEDFDG